MPTPPTFVTGQVLTAAQMNTIGLHLIATRSVSNSNQMVFDNVFTSDYLNYLVIFSVSASATTQSIRWQERVNGSNAVTSYSSVGQGYYLSAGTPYANLIGEQNNSDGVVGIFDGTSGSQGHCIFEIHSPATSAYTSTTGRWSFAAGNTGIYHGVIGSNHYVSTVYDGFRLFVNVGSFTATGRLYGYRN